MTKISQKRDFLFMYIKIQKQIFASKEKELTKAEYERLLDAAKSKKNERKKQNEECLEKSNKYQPIVQELL